VVADPLVSLGRLENDEFGYGLAYAEDWWTPASDEGSELKLVIEWEEYGDPELWLLGAPSTDRTPDQLMADQLDMLRERFLGLSADEHDENAILDPAIGFERGSATSGTFAGTTDSPQGPGRAVLVFMEAVTDGRLTLSAALVLTGNYTLDTSHDSPTMWFRVKADNVLNAITWPVR
jgi:hypothetical protein